MVLCRNFAEENQYVHFFGEFILQGLKGLPYMPQKKTNANKK